MYLPCMTYFFLRLLYTNLDKPSKQSPELFLNPPLYGFQKSKSVDVIPCLGVLGLLRNPTPYRLQKFKSVNVNF